MCGRYTYFDSAEIIKRYNLEPKVNPQLELGVNLPDNYNVSPGNKMPVIVRGEQEHELQFMIWGLIPVWNKPGSKPLKLINARKEGLLEKPMWKRLVKSRRCVVPARGFYEWKKVADEKVPYYITPKKGDVFSFAGLWDEWTNEKGEKEYTYSIITTTPNKEMAEIHNRMPAILNKDQLDAWLAPTDIDHDLLDDLVKPAPDGTLKLIKVSSKVNNARNNSKDLIYPLED